MSNRQDFFRDFYDPNDGFLNSFDPGFEPIDGVDWANFDDCDGNFFAPDRLDDDGDGYYEDEDGFDDGWYDDQYDGDDAKFMQDNRFFKNQELEWTVPQNPKFIVDGTSMNDINQRGIGDCWFLASLSSLARCPELISFVIQKQRNETVSPDEGYTFKFYKMEKWITCKVDKLLPTSIMRNYNKEQFASNAKDNEYWVPYCEKAYAKRYKTYDNIDSGIGMWALTDLTGGISIRLKLNWDDAIKHNFFAFLYDNQKDVIVVSGIAEDSEEIRQKELVGGHVYSLVKLELVETSDGGMVQLMNIRNPHGQKEFTGDWSDRSAKWDLVDPERRDQLLAKRVDGAFWMCFKDWVQSFDYVDFCLLPDVFSEKKNGPTFRHERAVRGIFQHENTNVEIQMSVSETSNVYCQTLMDCSLKENPKPYICFAVKDNQDDFVQPRLPLRQANIMYEYCHRSFLFNLKPGEYIVSVAAQNVKDKKWLFRAVSPHVTLTVLE